MIHYHLSMLYKQVIFKDIQNKTFAEIKKDIDMLLRPFRKQWANFDKQWNS